MARSVLCRGSDGPDHQDRLATIEQAGVVESDPPRARMTTYRHGRVVLERLPYDAAAWEATIANHPDVEVFHGAPWLEYLAASQGAEPVIAVVQADGRPIGHFVGAIVRRYGVRILGSPLRGWGTQCMGFLLEEGADRRAAAEAVRSFAFGQLGCHHVELADRRLGAEELAGSDYLVEVGHSYVVDLLPPEEEIFARMHSKTRQYIRKAIRQGLSVAIADDLGFADTFHAQLTEIFARQGLSPTYPVDRVRQLIATVGPSGGLLLLKVLGPDGTVVGTGIVVGRNKIAVNWGAAWFRADAELHPIQLFWWEAMRYWRSRGAVRYDMGGAGEYKAKYGGVVTPTAHFNRSRYGVLRYGRAAAKSAFRARQILSGRRSRPPADSEPA